MILAETQRGFGGPVALLAALAVFGVFVWYMTNVRHSPPPPPDAPKTQRPAKTSKSGDDSDEEPDYSEEVDPTREHLGYTVTYDENGERTVTPRYADEQ